MQEEAFGAVVATVPKNKSEEVRISLSEFRGTRLVDVRTYTDIAGKLERLATKKGVSVSVRLLPDLIEGLHQAAAEARRLGLLEPPVDLPRPWWERD